MKPVRWLSNAHHNFAHILDYTRDNLSNRAALALLDKVESAVEIISHYPEIGRIGDEQGTRRFNIPDTPFFIVYLNAPEEVQIWRVMHGAQSYI